ncbi:MAG: 16S rRNA (uracil(1498)-N(3))-methyltransferase [Lachnospiraceae bacterium]|nr:16S rRNA (uracil(1498)-N(3))-methyltransferase [Lachnospiraceae bacterium]
MFQFFVEPEQIHGEEIVITGSDVNHIKNVLRMRTGEQLRISDNEGGDFYCKIQNMEEQRIILQITGPAEDTEPGIRITLFQGLPKGDKMELVIQKAVELGVFQIIPVAMKNCVVKLDEKKAKAKQLRWQAIAESAAKQSKRSIIPQIGKVMSFKEAAEYASKLDVRLLPYENQRGMAHTREVMGGIQKGSSVGIFIGPEGGYDSQEIALVQEQMEMISLGNRVLRTETAGLCALSMLLYALED